MVKYGYWYSLPLLAIAAGLIGFRIYWLGVVLVVLAALVLNFFRDPDRQVPSDNSILVSPADGRIVQIAEQDFGNRVLRRVSIFMSPLDVHVNRSPIAGVITDVAYQKGLFLVASAPRASIENEQNVFTVEGEQGTVIVKQIAGALARRIVFWKRPGEVVERGERVGLIKFGSRVDVLAGPEVEWRVRTGERVRAGSSILGTFTDRIKA